MIILEHSTFDASTIGRNLGLPEYSYWFVRKAFRPVLERFGVVIPVSKPQQDADRICRSAQAHGQSCVYLSFNPPNLVPVDLECSTVPVFAWEYDIIPNEVWNGDPANDWTHVLAQAPAAITHSRFSVESVRRALGSDYPIWSIPAPVADRHIGRAATACGWREPFELSLGSALVFDTRTLDLSIFAYGEDERSLQALRLLQASANADRGRPARRVGLQGVVYTAVFNPVDGRKNWYDMVAGFIYAFRDQPDATLILKTTHRDLAEGVLLILQDLAKLGRFACRILIVHGLLDDADYAALVDATSYAVNTSHGEGQCLPLMEFMSAGRPALAPLHTAMIDYVSADNAFVIGSHQRPAFWPHDVRQAIRCLRHQVDFADVVRCYRESFAVARDEATRYAAMSRAAVTALGAFCSDEVVVGRMQQVLDHLGAKSTALPWGRRSGVSSVQETPTAPARALQDPTLPDKAPVPGQPRVDGFLLGLQDAMETGWYNIGAGELAAGFPVTGQDVVVDVGCGDGGPVAFCARQGAHVILADMDAERLAGAAARLKDTPARKIESHVTDANPLPLPDACASRVICMEVLEHVEDTAVLMAELVRVGRPGALYLITVPGDVQERMQKHLAPPQYFERPNHIRIIDPQSFGAMVEAAGLTIERRYTYSFYWAMWWMMFWQCSTSLEAAAGHPMLAAWAQTWSLVLKGRDGPRIQALLNGLMPKNQVIIAQKPL